MLPQLLLPQHYQILILDLTPFLLLCIAFSIFHFPFFSLLSSRYFAYNSSIDEIYFWSCITRYFSYSFSAFSIACLCEIPPLVFNTAFLLNFNKSSVAFIQSTIVIICLSFASSSAKVKNKLVKLFNFSISSFFKYFFAILTSYLYIKPSGEFFQFVSPICSFSEFALLKINSISNGNNSIQTIYINISFYISISFF